LLLDAPSVVEICFCVRKRKLGMLWKSKWT
jgi:hypothetical protein